MDIKERLNLFISSKGLSNRAFEEICKIGNGASGMNKNKNGMQTAKVEKIISTFPELNADWLITGRGSMIYNENIKSFDSTELERLREENSMLIETNRNLSRMLSSDEKRKVAV